MIKRQLNEEKDLTVKTCLGVPFTFMVLLKSLFDLEGGAVVEGRSVGGSFFAQKISAPNDGGLFLANGGRKGKHCGHSSLIFFSNVFGGRGVRVGRRTLPQVAPLDPPLVYEC